jgi:ribose-phosphate pyrophosphokinase
VEIQENVRGRDVYLIQSTCAPANDHLMELLVMTDACKRSSAGRITAVIPYYGYARQDRKVAPRAPISAKLVADLLQAAGVHRVLTMDLHAGQIQGFFDIPVDNLYAKPRLVDFLARETYGQNKVIVSPDAGGAERARSYAKALRADLAIIDKRRSGPNVAEVMHVVGEVKGRHAVILDDMVDTAGTLCHAARAIHEAGATSVIACATHPVFSGPAIERIQASALQRVIVTDTIPLAVEALGCEKIGVVSVAELFGEAIRSIHYQDSVSRLFV